MPQAAIKPNRRIESAPLCNEDMRQFHLKRLCVFRGSKIPPEFFACATECTRHTGNQLAGTVLRFCTRNAGFSEIFRCRNICRKLRPVCRHFNLFLFKDDITLFVVNDRVAAFPFQQIVRMNAGLGKIRCESESHPITSAIMLWRGCLFINPVRIINRHTRSTPLVVNTSEKNALITIL